MSQSATRRARVQRAIALIAGGASLALFPLIAQCACPNLDASGNTIEVCYTLPGDLNQGNATRASLPQAATFAWNEFIALNWPALARNGNHQRRDDPDPSQPFGDPGYQDPLVWHTFRGKVEIFPQDNSAAYNKGPSTDYGYDDPPRYNYGQADITGATYPAPWINLDENSQLGLNKIYTGVVPGATKDPNSQILFMAKGNRNEYRYITANQWWAPNPALFARTRKFVAAYKRDPVAGSTDCDGNALNGPCVSLPNDTIEVKAAWRRLTQDEKNSGRFYTTLTRHYTSSDSGVHIAAHDEVMGLIGLHIIRKTASAPYFIYATFEQADNITLASGDPVEDEDGNYRSVLKGVTPMTPNVVSHNAGPHRQQTFDTPASYPSTPNKQLYYQNTDVATGGLLNKGIILVNRRINSIPDEIIAANKTAHDTIRAYAATRNYKTPPVWLYYKLVNVQNVPLGEKIPGIDRFPRATYYQSNSVIETDYNLQKFSGEFDDFRNRVFTITDFTADGGNLKNVAHQGQSLNMGGCMGCHGNAQAAGSGFSFIFLDAPTVAPEWDSKPLDSNKFRRFLNYMVHP